MTDAPKDLSQNTAFPADAAQVIDAFGGIRPMAARLKIAATTVQGWKKRGAIPESRHEDILNAAQEAGIDLSALPPRSVETSAPSPDPESPAAPTEKPQASSAATDPASSAEKPEPPLAAPPQSAQKPPIPESSLRPPHAQHIGSIPRSPHSEDEILRARAEEKLRERPQFFSESVPADLVEKIRGIETRSSRIAALIAAIFVGAAICFTVIVLWPTARKVNEYDDRLTAVEGTVMHLGEEEDSAATATRAATPDSGWVADLDRRMDDWKKQASAVKSDVESAIGQAKSTVNEITNSETGPLSERLSRLEHQVEEISGSTALSDLVARIESYSGTIEGQGALDQMVAQLRDLAMGTNGDPQAFDSALDSARTSDPALGQTFEGVAPGDLKAAAMLVGLTNLRSALARDNVPFKTDLDLLMNLVGDDNPELKTALLRIAPQAEKGVLTNDGLSKELRGLAGDVVTASLKGEDVSFEERARARLNEVLQVEKKGELVTGTPTQETISRAQSMVETGDVQGAIGALQGLNGPAAEAAQPWIGQAEATEAATQLRGLIDNLMRAKTIGHGAKYTTGFKGLSDLVPARPVIHDEESGVIVMPPPSKLPGAPSLPAP